MAEANRKDQGDRRQPDCATIAGVDLPWAIAIQFTVKDRGFV